MFDKLTDRVFKLFGLDFDFSVSMRREAFNLITRDLYLGARPGPELVPALKDAGITHVVSCLREEERDGIAYLNDGFETLFLPVHDGMGEDIASVFSTFFDFVEDASKESPASKVLVHCEAGVSRSATLAIALRMRHTKSDFYGAYRAVRAKRAEVLPNIGFATQLYRLEQATLPPRSEQKGEPATDQRTSSLARYLKEVCMVPIEIDTLQSVLNDHDHDALKAIRAIFGEDVPRVIQGVRV